MLILSQFAGAAEEMSGGADRQSLQHRRDRRRHPHGLGNEPRGACRSAMRPLIETMEKNNVVAWCQSFLRRSWSACAARPGKLAPARTHPRRLGKTCQATWEVTGAAADGSDDLSRARRSHEETQLAGRPTGRPALHARHRYRRQQHQGGGAGCGRQVARRTGAGPDPEAGDAPRPC